MAKTKSVTSDQKEEINVRDTLKNLLKLEAHAIFEREPAPAFTAHLDALVDKIIKLFED